MAEPFPTDIEAIRRTGLAAWRAGYRWPFPWVQYHAFVAELWDAFDALVLELEQGWAEAVLVDAHFATWLRDVIHAAAVRDWAAAEGRELVVGSVSHGYYAPDWQAESRFAPAEEVKPDLVWRLRSLAKGVRADGLRGVLAQGFAADAWFLGSRCDLALHYAAAQGLRLRHDYAERFLAQVPEGRPAVPPNVAAALARFAARLAARAQDTLGLAVPEPARWAETWGTRLARAVACLDGVTRALPRRLPDRLLLAEVGRPAHRIMAFAARRRGVQVVGFNHGGEMGHVLQRYLAYTQYAQTDLFICETAPAAEAHAAEYGLGQLRTRFPVRFASAEAQPMAPRYEALRRARPPEAVRRVMLIGFPHNARRDQYDHTDFSPFHLEAELRILETLRAAGLATIYKTHPDRRREAGDLFDAFADQVIATPFEAVVEQADAFVFPHTITSTFALAMATSRPVVLLDSDAKPWNPALRPLVLRRCRAVPAVLDASNRIAFDERALVSAVTAPPTAPDHAYLDHAMLPARQAQPCAA